MNEGPVARLAAEWDRRVRANREQVERIRVGDEAADFYAPVTSRFVLDPRRTDDPVLEALLGLAGPQQRWLDVGAGAGRYALPLALAVREVIAVEPSAAMVAALREGMAAHDISNVTISEERWPPPDEIPAADVALIAHVGYDVEPISPFLDALERAAPRCVAVLANRSPATFAARFWPPIHGQPRLELPALDDLVSLLRARGVRPRVRRLPLAPRRFPDEEALLAMLRQQLWIAAGGQADEQLRDLLRREARTDADGIGLDEEPGWVGVADWEPSDRRLSSADG